MKLSPRRWILSVILILVIGFGLIQLIPYGRDHTSPPARGDIKWDSPRTEELVRGACYDCHSNQTVWPWYGSVAPASWLLRYDIDKATYAFNFDDITPEQGKGMVGLMVQKVKNNEMPPARYQMMHATARFSAQERQDLIDGLLATFK